MKIINSVDKIVQGNTSNIVFLKSTDDSMLDTLQKMSGITHRTYIDSKNVSENKQRLFNRNEDTVSYTITTKEVPVISYNDMAFISERQSIVFRAGDSPIWNRNEMILPMSWRLFKDTIVHVGHDYSLQTIPTLSSALDFDVRKNQPDFIKMLDKRIEQANLANTAKEAYQKAYNYSDYQIEQLDPDNYADDIMEIINQTLRRRKEADGVQAPEEFEMNHNGADWHGNAERNEEQLQANEAQRQKMDEASRPIYAGHKLSKEDLVSMTSGPNHQYDMDIIASYVAVKGDFRTDYQYFREENGDLYGVNGDPYILHSKVDAELNSAIDTLNRSRMDPSTPVFAEEEIEKGKLKDENGYVVTDNFLMFLVSLPKWSFARGRFEVEMARRMNS